MGLIMTLLIATQVSGLVEPNIGRSVPSEPVPSPEIEAMVVAEWGENDVPNVSYRYNYVDLNDDGTDEVIVLFGGSYCGTGGCTLSILEADEGHLHERSYMTLARAPIIVSDTRTNGWHDLVIYQRGSPEVVGGPRVPFYAVMRFDGETYPLNPSMQPRLDVPVIGTAYVSDVGNRDSEFPIER